VRLALALLVVAAACDGGSPDFAVIAPAEPVTLVQGQPGTITVGLASTGGFDGTVVITAGGLVAGVTPGAISLRGDQAEGTLALQVESSAPAGQVDGAFLIGASGDLERTAPLDLEVVAP